jgi:hypothetical protein
MSETNQKKQKASKPHKPSKGERRSSMKTSGFKGAFVPSMKHVKPGYSSKQAANLHRWLFEQSRSAVQATE